MTMYFCYFPIIPPWKRAGPYIWTNLNTLYPRMHCAKFGWDWPSGSGKDFLISINVFLLFCNYLPFEKGTALYLIKFLNLCTQGWFLQSSVNWSNGSGEEDERRWKCEKFTTTRRLTADNFRSEELTRVFGSLELKTHKRDK